MVGGNGGFALILAGTVLLWASLAFFSFSSLIFASSVALVSAAAVFLISAGAFLLAGNKDACFLSVVTAQRLLRSALKKFGFAFNLINLWNYLSQKKLIPEKMEKDFFIIDTTPDKEIAHKVADFLRQRGYSVARDIVERKYEDSIKYAFEKGFKNVIVIGIDRGSKDIYIYSVGGSIEKLPFEEFLKKFQ